MAKDSLGLTVNARKEVIAYLSRLSKGALVDCLLEQLALGAGSGDEPENLSLASVKDSVRPRLRVRGDSEPKVKTPNPPMRVILKGYGNPDMRQWSPVATPNVVPCDDFRAALRLAANYIQANELGGGNWVHDAGDVIDDDDKVIAKISYNGRLWAPDGKEITP